MNMKRNIMSLLLVAMAAMASATSVDSVLNVLKTRIAPDKRVAVWDISTTIKDSMAVLEGSVGYPEQLQAINDALVANNIKCVNNVKVLSTAIALNKQWALVKLSVATLRCEPKHSAEVATQSTMGTPLRVLEEVGEWLRVQCPDDYIAYVPESSVMFVSQEDLKAWNRGFRCIVTVYDDRLVTEPSGDETVSDLVLGDILMAEAFKDGWAQLRTPDGRKGWVSRSSVEYFDKWAQQDINLEIIEKTAKRMMGSTYLWGGTTTKMTDCSGLVKVSYFSNGIILQRDASQQALTGLKIDDWHNARLCDLLFFGNSTTKRVTHVGLYLHDGKFIHCSGQVKINDLNPEAPDYLYSPLSISRIDGQIGTKGIVYVRDHKWYFNN